MKRLAVFVLILMLGISPAAAQDMLAQPVRGAALDAMVREILEWITQNTEYAASGSPDIVFVDQAEATIATDFYKRRGGASAWDRDNPTFKFSGLYNPKLKTVFLREDWDGDTTKGWGKLAHELVHYAQFEADKKFQCREDEEQEALVLSFVFLNDKFDNQWPDAIARVHEVRRNQTTCTPHFIPATVD